MDLDREIRLRYRDLVLAVAAAMALDAALVLLVYVVDASPLGPLRRFGGPWGLPCIAAGRCLPTSQALSPSADKPAPAPPAQVVPTRDRPEPRQPRSIQVHVRSRTPRMNGAVDLPERARQTSHRLPAQKVKG
jgi:hypothetical protein